MGRPVKDPLRAVTMAEEQDAHRTFRESVVQEHEERLTGYRALLARQTLPLEGTG